MLPPGQRYGQEMYDQRMKAVRRLRVNVKGNLDVQAGEDGDDAAEQEQEGKEAEAENEVGGRLPSFEIYDYNSDPDTPETTSTPQPNSTSTTSTPPPAPAPASPHRKTPLRNPLHQFGLLTPPPLRTSQKAFTSALNTIPDLLNTSRAMAQLEEEIERVRASLGLDLNSETETETDPGNAAVDDDENETEDLQTEKESETCKEGVDGKIISPTSSQRRSLTSRSKMSEPRSRVLKLRT